MPFCRECGGQVEATWKFCPHCNSEQESSVVIGNDSVHVGDITVNKIDEIKQGLEEVLAGLGFTKDSSPTELTSSQEKEVEQVLEMSEQLASHGIEIDPWTEITLGMQHDYAEEHILHSNITYGLWKHSGKMATDKVRRLHWATSESSQNTRRPC